MNYLEPNWTEGGEREHLSLFFFSFFNVFFRRGGWEVIISTRSPQNNMWPSPLSNLFPSMAEPQTFPHEKKKGNNWLRGPIVKRNLAFNTITVPPSKLIKVSTSATISMSHKTRHYPLGKCKMLSTFANIACHTNTKLSNWLIKCKILSTFADIKPTKLTWTTRTGHLTSGILSIFCPKSMSNKRQDMNSAKIFFYM